MLTSSERVPEILRLLNTEFPELLKTAISVALSDSLPVRALVWELESHGYRLENQIEFELKAVPFEAVFEQSLTESDRLFLDNLAKRTETPS